MNLKNYLLLTFLFISTLGYSQNGNDLFDKDTLHEIRFTFSESNFWNILNRNYNNSVDPNTGVPTDVPYLQGTFSFDGEVMDSVGLRQKGFSSYFASNDLKKSFKVDLNEFVSGQNFDGIKKFNLSNGVGDPALQRDVICYDLMRKAGINAPRTAHAKVYLNDEYWGIYVIIEQVDKTFLNANFADGNGNLYKNIGWSELKYLGDNPDDYAESIALRTNEDTPDWSDYTELVKVINQTPQSQFKEEIEKVFNVDYYLRVLAIDVMTNNWDSYIEHGRNFYLYHEPSSSQFFWIPWDYNLAMGGNFDNGDPGGGPGGPINDPENCPTILSGDAPHSPEDSLFQAVIEIAPFCCFEEWDGFCQEAYNHLDNIGDCNSIVNGTSPYPVSDPIFQQVTFFEPQCCSGDWDASCQEIYEEIEYFENGGGGERFEDFPLEMGQSEKILIRKILMVPEYRQRYYNYACHILDDNFTFDRLENLIDQNTDLIADAVELEMNSNFPFEDFLYDTSEGIDSSRRSIPSLKQFINNRIELLGDELDSLGHNCSATLAPIDWHDVVINEFVASNDSTSNIFDQDGEADDWIELYNNTAQAVDLTDFFLSDNYDNPLKWDFPAGTTIPANGFLIVWADENGMEDGLHANFKLAKGGESIMLVHSDGTFIDSLSFGQQETNIPYARVPNGTGDFQSHYPTFNMNNDGPSAVNELDGVNFKVYPNPANEMLNITFENDFDFEKVNLSMTNMLGQIVFRNQNQFSQQTQIDVSGLTPGLYFLILEKGKSRVAQKVVVK